MPDLDPDARKLIEELGPSFTSIDFAAMDPNELRAAFQHTDGPLRGPTMGVGRTSSTDSTVKHAEWSVPIRSNDQNLWMALGEVT
jgi:hypothetical protein